MSERRPRPPVSYPLPDRWQGFDYETTCNLCHIWQPSPRSDERLLAITDFNKLAFTAALYRDQEQGRVLVAEWARRHGGDVERLLRQARL